MIRLALTLMVAFARVLFRSRLELLIENLALRQQMAVFKQQHSRPRMQPADRMFWVFVVLHHQRRRILHFAVTEHPDAAWVTQQLREAFPFDTAPHYAILDRDGKYGHQVPAALQSLGVQPARTALRSPWQNPFVEQFGGTLRRELLDKIIVFNETQLHRVVREFVTYYHQDRCHLGLGKEAPDPRVVTPQPSSCARVVGLPRVGGLQHRYEWREAA